MRELHIRALTLIPVTCEQLVVGDRVKVKHDGKPGAIYKVISPGYFQVAIDGDTPFCAPGDEQWHPYFLISGLEPIDK